MEYTKLKYINEYQNESINPSQFPETEFEMYSVPSYDTWHPEYVIGKDIGSSKILVQKNDILLCKINPRINRVWIVSDESDKQNIASSEWIVIRNHSYNPEYLAWYFRSKFFQNYMTSEVTGIGGSLTRAQPKRVGDYPVPVLSREEQDNIVKTLNTLQKVVNAKKEELNKCDYLIKARFVEMFGDQKTNPLGWKQACIGDVCTLKSGTSLPIDKENEGGDIPYIKVGDMNYPGNERYIISSSRFVSRKTAGKGIFNIGSIIFPKRGGAIGTNKKRMTKVPICADLNIMGITPNGELIPEYLLSYFDMLDMRELADGSSVPQINNKNISPLKICVPPLIKQEEFAKIVKQIDKSKLLKSTIRFC